MKNQGVTEELRCLGLLNALDKNRDIPEDLAQLLGESCIKLAEGIKAYISKVSLHLELVKKHQSSITQPVKPDACCLSPGLFIGRRLVSPFSQRSDRHFLNNKFHFSVSAQWQKPVGGFLVKLLITAAINVSKQVSHF